MNSYDENLHSTVVTSLQTLELAQKSMKSKLDASIFTLYFTEGARISAGEKLDDATQSYHFQKRVKEQAVNNNNISINLLTTANQQKKYTAQSVTNAAVCAANVKLATNAVVKLAADVGSIYSILLAADFGTEIYELGSEAYHLMNATAYRAESAYRTAMDTSTQTAEVSSGTVADDAKKTNDAISNLLKITSADFDTISATVAADNAALATASAAEKKAEGKLEFINVEYFATNSAYQINNRELNQNLTVTPQNADSIPEDERSNDSYTVSFDYYKSPFTEKEALRYRKNGDKPRELEVVGYPVKDYYIMLVKDSKKLTFTIENAETILTDKDTTRYRSIPGAPKRPRDHAASETIFINQLSDTDGETMKLGQKYVVFVLAVFLEEYKKTINNFDDYLSAPSATFKLTNRLSSPIPGKENVIVKDKTLVFSVSQNAQFPVEYRCMFLPDNKDLVKGLLTVKGLRTIDAEVAKLQTISKKYDPIIDELDAQLATLNATLDSLLSDEAAPQSSKAEKKEKNAAILETKAEIHRTTTALNSNIAAKTKALKSLVPTKPIKPGFFFNLKLAEQVAAGNYTLADMSPTKNGFAGHAHITENTTDNFGNPLIPGKNYVPVVLSVSTAPEENLDQYTNSLSDYASTESFPYVQPKSN